MVLKEASQAVLDYVKENGGRVALAEVAEALGRSTRSISGSMLTLTKHEFAVREKEDDVTYIVLTDKGMNFVPSED